MHIACDMDEEGGGEVYFGLRVIPGLCILPISVRFLKIKRKGNSSETDLSTEQTLS